MSLSIIRQGKLKIILEALAKLDGVTVQSDDFDSVWVNVFIYMDKIRLNQPPYGFYRKTNNAIKKALSKESFNVLDYPAMQYDRSTFRGQTETFCKGYDHNHVKIEVMV